MCRPERLRPYSSLSSTKRRDLIKNCQTTRALKLQVRKGGDCSRASFQVSLHLHTTHSQETTPLEPSPLPPPAALNTPLPVLTLQGISHAFEDYKNALNFHFPGGKESFSHPALIFFII